MLVRQIDIFIASPGDVDQLRRDAELVVNELQATLGHERKVSLVPIRWETRVAPGVGRPQAQVNSQVGQYDLFIGILWKRFGSPSGLAQSGTEEEIRIALERWQHGKASDLLLYFCEEPWWPASEHELEQCARVMRFRSELSSHVMTRAFERRDAFAPLLRQHLYAAIVRLLEADPDSPATMRIEVGLAHALDTIRREAVMAGSGLHTPHFLLALLRLPNSQTAACLERIEPDLSAQIEQSLAAYVARRVAPTQDAPRLLTDWPERNEMIAAWREARNAGDFQITERDLLVVLLRDQGKTMSSLRARLRDRFETLVKVAAELPRAPRVVYVTPGPVDFGTTRS